MSAQDKSRFPYGLIFSLVLNGLLIGLILGGGLRERAAPPPDRGERALVRGLERSLNDEERAAVRQALRQAFSATRPERQNLRKARRDLRRALGASSYDKDAVFAAFARVRTAEAAAQEGLHRELARQFERLTPEQRASVLRGMERPLRRGRGSSRSDGRGEHPPNED